MFGRLNKKSIIKSFTWVVTVLFAIIIIAYIIHDVRLNEEILKLSTTDTPEIRIENVRFERDMFGSLWKINIPSLERQKEIIRILSIDITRIFSNDETWRIKGNSGEYIENSEKAALNGVSGHIVLDGHVLEILATRVSWEKSGDLVILSDGFRINSKFSSLSADKAIIEDANLVTIEGGEIVWNFVSYDLR